MTGLAGRNCSLGTPAGCYCSAVVHQAPTKRQRIELPPLMPPLRDHCAFAPYWRTTLTLGCKANDNQQPGSQLCSLPQEVLERVLSECDCKKLAALETTCRFFITSGGAQKAAQQQLAKISRAKYFQPEDGETWITLLQFAECQSTAAAQATAVSLGSYHTAAILTTEDHGRGHALATFGRGFHGQLGRGSFTSSSTPQSSLESSATLIGGHSSRQAVIERPAVVACGNEHTAAISSRGELFTWGLAGNGELGRVHWQPADAATPQAAHSLHCMRMVSVAAGANHTLAISEGGEVWSCGHGRSGQLGIGHYQDEHQLRRVHIGFRDIVAVAAGQCHSAALGSDGTVWTWGSGRLGQLGHEVIADFMAANNDPLLTLPVPQALCSLDPAKLLPDHRVTAISAGGDHTLVLTVGGSLLAFGCNKHGCLGLGDTCKRTIATQVVLSHLQGSSRAPIRVVQMACGRAHSLLLVHHGGASMVCSTGYNYFGQLGLGDTASRTHFTPVPGLRGRRIVAVSSGDHHCAAVSATGRLYLWGRGDCGQLGMGDNRNLRQATCLPGARVVHPNVTLRRLPPPATYLSADYLSGKQDVGMPRSSRAAAPTMRHTEGTG